MVLVSFLVAVTAGRFLLEWHGADFVRDRVSF